MTPRAVGVTAGGRRKKNLHLKMNANYLSVSGKSLVLHLAKHLPPVVVVLLGCLQLLTPPTAHSQATLPAGFSETRIRGIGSPTALALTPDGRALVCSQDGTVNVIKNDVLLPTPMITLKVSALTERGLDGIQVDPNFAINGFLYLYYAALTPTIHNRLSRFTVHGDIAAPASEVSLFELPSLSSSGYHNGGSIQFGPDGKLYCSVGENNIPANAQSLQSTLGKILRLNPDGSIPTDNPFVNATTGNNRAIYALGFRNPYTIAFQPGTGRLFVNDVGSFLWEEINEVIAGGNYGWPTFEGRGTAAGFQSPIHTYPHPAQAPTSSAITGGSFYNPETVDFPAQYVGKYFFADGFQQFIKVLDPATKTVSPFATFAASLYAVPPDKSAVAVLYPTVGKNGFLYYLARSATSALFSGLTIVRFTGGSAPLIGLQPVNQLTFPGGTANFEVAANGSAPLTYQWFRRNTGAPNFAVIPGATAPLLALSGVGVPDNGAEFRCTIGNHVGATNTHPALLTVTTSRPPVPIITAPAEGTFYRAGDTVAFAGSATDPDEGTLPPAKLSWRINFHHLEHTHPVLPETAGISQGTFFISPIIETSPVVWFRIYLTATDSAGLSTTVFRDVLPIKSTHSLATDPPGLQVFFDGHAAPTPTNWTGVVGVTRTLGAENQYSGGNLYAFDSWSDGGAALHDIATPELDTTYIARFRLVPPVDSAAMTSLTVPASMFSGLNYTISVRMQNTGNTPWPANSSYVLAAQNPADNAIWRATPVALDGPVAPGDSHTFTFPVKAPTIPDLYNLQWQMQKAGLFFGTPSVNSVVTITASTDAGANSAVFVSQGIPATMAPGGTYNVLVTMRNTGTAPWFFDARHRLGSANPRDNKRWGLSRVTIANVNGNLVNPGESQTFEFRVKAPLTPGQYSFQWQMIQEAVGWFGALSANRVIKVTATGSTPVTFAMQPANQSAPSGQSSAFFAGAIGSSPITFQWQRQSPSTTGFTSVPGATASTYVTPSVGVADTGATYRCVATNPAGTFTSAAATLTVNAASGIR